ncbi:MAG TPA: hypothetical protein VF173_21280 [Thermoanaerobaculia bacterium]|nr:hypothetical protein [Thermoanaerobaculia bacterium]
MHPSESKTQTGTVGHTSGFHASSRQATFTCTCNTSCYQTCDVQSTSTDCSDTGGTVENLCHKMASGMNSLGSSSADGTATPARCVVGWGCVERACQFCACSLGVEVSFPMNSLGGPDFDVTGGTPDWIGNLVIEEQCSACQEDAGSPGGGGGVGDPGTLEQIEPGYGGSGGGGYTWCYTSCTYYTKPDGSGVLTCTPTNICGY